MSDKAARTEDTDHRPRSWSLRRCLALALLLALTLILNFASSFAARSDTNVAWRRLSHAPADSAHVPLDGHVDLPILVRYLYANQLGDLDLRNRTKGEVDLPRLRKGRVGGFFWSVFVPCPEDAGYGEDRNFTTPSFRVRDTLEQIDTARLLIEEYSDTFKLVSNAREWSDAMRRGKIASMLGVEGGHQLGSSLASIRVYFALGVRYLTLTHTCNNAIADSCGAQGGTIASQWNGLSPFGRVAVKELNRIGMMVDVSHVSPKTASDALTESTAPVIFSHSNARGLHPVVRNIPDSILRRIGRIHSDRRFNLTEDGERGRGWGSDTGEVDRVVTAKDALVMLNFSPDFISEFPDGSGTRANVSLVADHADYIAKLSGKQHLGIGSDFDGILRTPAGLEDVSKYDALFAELLRRGWSDDEILGLAGGNLLRILNRVETVARQSRDKKPSTVIYEGRTDLKKHRGF
ncbi:hypothetical protein JCM16303_002243 [Sporobolomyces ruberrimus]